MKYRFAPSLLLVLATPVFGAELVGNLLVTTNDVWRGFSLSEDAPAVPGSIDYRHEYGLFASATVRVDGNSEQQLALCAGLMRRQGEWTFDGGIIGYEYVRGDRYNATTGHLAPDTANDDDFFEALIGAAFGNGQFRYHRSEDYLGRGELSNYYEFNYAAPFAGAQFLLHYGFTAVVDHSSQLSDMAFGLAKGPFAFVVSDLDDNEDGLQSRNARYIVSRRQSIEL